MPQTEILLVEHIDNLGSEGDVVKVRPGFARNFLLPRGKAVPLNHANKKRLDALKVSRAARESVPLLVHAVAQTYLRDLQIHPAPLEYRAPSILAGQKYPSYAQLFDFLLCL